MFMEHDDLYQAGGHTHIQIGPKLIEPPGECRSNHVVLQGLASRLGAQHPGFTMTEMQIIDATLRASGWPDAATVLRERWIDGALPFDQAHFLTGFPTRDKKFHFAPDWAAMGDTQGVMPRLPDYMPAFEAATAEHPFRLMTSPARSFLNTSFTEMPSGRKREGRPTVMVHPDDTARLGIGDGDRVTLSNADTIARPLRLSADEALAGSLREWSATPTGWRPPSWPGPAPRGRRSRCCASTTPCPESATVAGTTSSPPPAGNWADQGP